MAADKSDPWALAKSDDSQHWLKMLTLDDIGFEIHKLSEAHDQISEESDKETLFASLDTIVQHAVRIKELAETLQAQEGGKRKRVREMIGKGPNSIAASLSSMSIDERRMKRLAENLQTQESENSREAHDVVTQL